MELLDMSTGDAIKAYLADLFKSRSLRQYNECKAMWFGWFIDTIPGYDQNEWTLCPAATRQTCFIAAYDQYEKCFVVALKRELSGDEVECMILHKQRRSMLWSFWVFSGFLNSYRGRGDEYFDREFAHARKQNRVDTLRRSAFD